MMEIVYEYDILWIKVSSYFIEACVVSFLRDPGKKGVGMEAHGSAELVPVPRLPCFQAPFFRAFLLSRAYEYS